MSDSVPAPFSKATRAPFGLRRDWRRRRQLERPRRHRPERRGRRLRKLKLPAALSRRPLWEPSSDGGNDVRTAFWTSARAWWQFWETARSCANREREGRMPASWWAVDTIRDRQRSSPYLGQRGKSSGGGRERWTMTAGKRRLPGGFEPGTLAFPLQ